MSSSSEQKLLVALVALERRLLSRETWLAEYESWTGDRNQTFAEYLVQRGLLTPAQLASLVASLTDSPRALPADSSATLAQEATPNDLATLDLGMMSPLPSHAPLDASGLERRSSAGSPSANRYLFLRAHAKGGLGQVSLALDRELNRHVALKEILPHRAAETESQGRFVMEAEITGQLEHPGIVPIYGLGTYPDGRPYYAMRFVEGENLKRAIEAFHASHNPTKPLAGQQAIDFRQLLGRFVDVCNAVEYAHSRHVLHRDLKPENILLGPYGETLVVDWGLAKTLSKNASDWPSAPEASSGENKASSSIEAGETTLGERTLGDATLADARVQPVRVRGGSGSETLDGSAIGTPAYMSPEQAKGAIYELGPATDVYSLGATLYALLTGKPPVRGDSVIETLEKVRRNEFPRPREAWPAVPRALEAVCLKAMAKEPAERYASAKALADELEKWLADEPVVAYEEPFVTRMRRWIKRHPVLVSTTVACTALSLAGALFVAYLQGAHAREVEQKNTTISNQLVELTQKSGTIQEQNTQLAQKNVDLATANEKEALARKEAEKKRDHAESVTDFLVKSFRKTHPEEDGKKLTVYDSLVRALNEIDDEPNLDPLNKAEILDAMRAAFHGLGMPAEELDAARRSLEIFRREAGQTHIDTLSSQNNFAVALSNQGDYDAAIKLLEETSRMQQALLGPAHIGTLTTSANLAGLYNSVGRRKEALDLWLATWQTIKQTLGENHPSTLTLQGNLASAYKSAGQFERAIELYQAALQTQEACFGAEHPSTLNTKSNLAAALDEAGQPEQALPLFESTLEAMRTKLGPDHLSTLVVQNNLARFYITAGEPRKAIPLLEHTLKVERASLSEDHPSIFTTIGNLAYAQESAGESDLAFPLYVEAFQGLLAKLGADHPSTINAQNSLALYLKNVGNLEVAIPALEAVLRRRKAVLGEEHPDTLSSQNNLALAYQDGNKIEQAIELLESAVEVLARTLGDDHPTTASTRVNLGMAYKSAGKLDLAVASLEKAYHSLEGKLGESHPYTSAARGNLGLGYFAARKMEEAIPLLEKAFGDHRERFSAEHATTLRLQTALATANLFTANLVADDPIKDLSAKGDPVKAPYLASRAERGKELVVDYVQRVRKLARGSEASWAAGVMPLAQELFDYEQYSAAERLLRQLLSSAAASDPAEWTTDERKFLLGACLLKQGKRDEAARLLREARDSLSKRTDRSSEAEAVLQKTIARLAEVD